jgi:hypothetical protein
VPGSHERTPDFLSSLLALANFMRLSSMKAAHAGVGGAPCKKSGYQGRKRWRSPMIALAELLNSVIDGDQSIFGIGHHAKLRHIESPFFCLSVYPHRLYFIDD